MKKLMSEKYLLQKKGFVYLFWPMVEMVATHMHEYYEFFIIKNGSAMHTINGNMQILPSNSLTLIRPNDFHQYKKVGKDPFSMYNAMINKELFDLMIANLDNSSITKNLLDANCPPVVQLSQQEADNLIRNIKLLITLSPDKEEAQTINRLILSFVLYKLLLSESSIHVSNLPLWLNQLTIAMQEEENFVEGLPALLSISNKSHEFICRSFQKYLHCSPSEFINQLRIKHSEFLLLSTTDSVTDIAMACGFNSISHFNHEFKKILSCSPTEYRENNKIVIADTYTDPRVMPRGSHTMQL